MHVDVAVATHTKPPALTTRAQKLTAARYEPAGTPEASLPSVALPQVHTYETIGPELWATKVDLRLGANIFSGYTLCRQCIQGRGPPFLDKLGYHAATCAVGNGSTRRQNKMRDLLYTVLRSYPLLCSTSREWTFPSKAHLPPEERHRLDIHVNDGSIGEQPVVLHVTVVSPHNARYTIHQRRIQSKRRSGTEG